MLPSYSLVLVHVDPTQHAARRIVIARQLAQEQGSELAALYAVTPSLAALPYTPEMDPSLAATLMEFDNARRDEVLKAFDKEMSKPGPVASWAQVGEMPASGSFAQQGMYADLVVLGQYDPEAEPARCVPPDFVESVIVASGRPALVVPHVGWDRRIGSTVAIAWKETPEAARAVQGAMPFLRRAGAVHVFTWGEQGAPGLTGRALDLQQYLRSHDVMATWHHEGEEPEALGEVLLSRVFDIGADLLVMGCYGHSRAREWMLGGVSRTMLSSMTLPVLLSH